jgi:hypothetical protein
MRIPAAKRTHRSPHQPNGLSLAMLMTIVALAISSSAFTQSRYDWRTNTDQVIHETDSLSLKSQRTFYLNKIMRRDEPLKETWYYTVHNNNIIVFEVRYRVDSLEDVDTAVKIVEVNRGFGSYVGDFLYFFADKVKYLQVQ